MVFINVIGLYPEKCDAACLGIHVRNPILVRQAGLLPLRRRVLLTYGPYFEMETNK
jgi:hypothetical protein